MTLRGVDWLRASAKATTEERLELLRPIYERGRALAAQAGNTGFDVQVPLSEQPIVSANSREWAGLLCFEAMETAGQVIH